MLVSSNSMNVAKVTVMAMIQGLTAGLAACTVLNGPISTWVATCGSSLFTPYTLQLKRCVHCTQRRKIKNLFELPRYRGNHFILHPLRIFPRITLPCSNQRTSQSVDGHADDLG